MQSQPRPWWTAFKLRTVMGRRRVVIVPSPNSPAAFEPQHATVPPRRTAQVWVAPVETAIASCRPSTWTGVRRTSFDPSPSWPWWFMPQHHTVPSPRTAQE